jgi:GNAT superfamily N-acetyltransferase
MTLELTFKPVETSNWRDLETLFESRGGPKHCWCMVWRRSSEEAKNQDGKFRKSLLKDRVDCNIPIGILAYADGKPIAWCSIAPRDTHRPTMAKVLSGDSQQNVWSLVCFYVQSKFRNQGVMRQMIGAAADYARAQKATILEAYPVERDSPSYRFGGFVEVFDEEGFERIGEAGIRRKVYRLTL